MQRERQTARRWRCDEQGVTSIEYALLAAMLAVVAIASVVALKGALVDTYQAIADAVTAALTLVL
ncbi:Flp family type IVb pilin [Burkholderia pseudomultivorans]|uniref:Flp/Fap pilin component family protein n=2 Tax=Burkholderia cepacia complex TaxID=87882 RepID=A0AAN0RMK3_9BURK|nr:Flp family type IVb pilin [Burkholderia pseudomultivorans]AIO30497.1 flp/Fap pilin component family protein [Burkholderia cenocepacia]AOI90335.1 pilus assembly protein [Burkholderia pseudomultivorans]KVC24409.1 pilus assembly protein [Burkholderia pseudomultivorans]KVC34127.1 pilus assembly protein [Burkholderia pseudomultivorans]KVC48511.1 pilus assembly protein [Burkholderia pseudomultivorans]